MAVCAVYPCTNAFRYRVQTPRLAVFRGRHGCIHVRSGRLFQQYIVDAYVSIEQNRLDYIRSHQNTFRTELLQGVHDAIFRGDTVGQDVGKRTFLPSSFTGGPRYMYKHYQDALAICRVYGNPQYFITFTCNANWPEIQRFMSRYPVLQSQDQPGVISRIFRMKVFSMIDFLKKKKPFGEVSAHLYTIEFQKRGLPHCHLLLWVKDAFKIHTPEQVDRYISAEIPDPVREPELHRVVADFMIHGPCGRLNPKSSCMKSSTSCSKNFPKDYQEQTVIDDNGYAHYKRASNGFTVQKAGSLVDSGYVVPYNKVLLLRYFAHINVEYCGWSMMIKYLFKYISKGADRIRFTISRVPNSTNENQSSAIREVDEIKNYLDGRFICPHEAAWRIFKFSIHERNPAVQVLSVHLENLQPVTFRDDDDLEDIVANPFSKKTTLTEWLDNNRHDPSGHHLRYVDYLTEYRWDVSGKFWLRRSYDTGTIGRLIYVHPTCGEAFYLRMLLAHQKGCQSFADIRTVAGVTFGTYREACESLGLLGDDNEWLNTLEEASFTATSPELRSLFTHMLLHCNITNPRELWNKFWHKMSHDITYAHGFINEQDLRHYVLYEIELLIRTVSPSSTLLNFGLPLPREDLIATLNNKLLMEEKNYDRAALLQQHNAMHSQLHAQQKEIYDYVITRLMDQSQVLAFVYGHGGTGKTFLWKTIIPFLRSRGDVVLAVASSGIASLLLPNGDAIEARYDIKDRHLDSKIKEDSCYNIDGHVCTDARSSGRVVNHPASILIAKRAKVDAIADRPIPHFYYNFANYEMLEDRVKPENKLLTDYLGLIETTTNVYRQQSYNLRKIKLLDQDGNNLMLTLWEKIAFDFNTENVVGKVLAVSSAKVTRHPYDNLLQLESTDTTVLKVDPPLSDLQQIKARLKHVQENKKPNTALQLALANSETGLTIAALMTKEPNEFKTKRYTVEARIKDYEPEKGWYKAKCTDAECTSPLYKEKGRLICPDNHQFTLPLYKFCVHATIVDDSGTMPVIFFNDEMQDMLGISCKTLVVEKGFEDSKKIPSLMSAFVGKLMNFTIRLRENNTPVIQAVTSINNNQPTEIPQLMLPSSEPRTPAAKMSRSRATDTAGKHKAKYTK
ncbi:hypothetical protein SSX86_028068 [Deinandra increscens subsp. villosa]|uniref:ATP-dependent DNA helicase n=1 Tax=Deinandra increscens subsp. villosa TaxID=3103831 RepID=A0AAP0C8P0_9ASTR